MTKIVKLLCARSFTILRKELVFSLWLESSQLYIAVVLIQTKALGACEEHFRSTGNCCHTYLILG